MKVGYQGISGSFSDEALCNYFGEETNKQAYDSFGEVIQAVQDESVTYGVLPLENSSTGGISQVYDLLIHNDVYMVGEICVKVDHNLLGVPGSSKEEIEAVYSHPQALWQCATYLKEQGISPKEHLNTAISAKQVSNAGCKTLGAIGSRRAAKEYGLDVLEACINDNTTNTTRFAILSKTPTYKPVSNKISLILSTENQPGALYDVIRVVAERRLNMLKIESRPKTNDPWEYYFFIDLEGSLASSVVIKALEEVADNCQFFKVIGHYSKDQKA